MKVTELKIAEFGDIHLGHPNTDAEHICRNLRRALPDNSVTGELDIIFLAGDVFDRQLSFADQSKTDDKIGTIKNTIAYILRLCKKWDIVLRILEGTPSHDWRQSSEFIRINDIAEIGADVVYIDKLAIEYIERFGIHVLYVPDEWRTHCDDTWKEVEHLLYDNSLTQVDFAIMHGCFPHQMPEILHKQLDMHNTQRYLNIVRYWIFIGHIHIRSQYERILAAGSFDRLCHGEELDKGHLRVNVRSADDSDVHFIVNEGAKVYRTIDFSGLKSTEIIETIDRSIVDLPKDSYIRIKADKGDEAISAISTIAALYSQFNWSSKINKTQTVAKPLLELEQRKHVVSLNRDTLKVMLMDRIQSKYPERSRLCEKLFDQIIQAN